MLYKALGIATWKGIRFFLRRRAARAATARNAAIAGGAVAATGATAVGVRKLRSS